MQTRELDFADERKVLTVSALNREARLLIESGLGVVWVTGEISNFSHPSSGHMYWSLKDARAQVRCAMFRQENRALAFAPEDGQQVLVRARVSIYETRGEFQLIVDEMEPAGEGLLRARFEALKRKLAAEGLFDAARKIPLPGVPARIGVVTSPSGAALHDVLVALKRRFPAVDVLIYPTSVQGEGAAAEICRALELADRRRDCDVLILTRGGGSLEDLWPFNEEVVARTIAALELPIIVGVGHEVDFTIAGFVADLRAPTPSQAAELAVPDQAEIQARLQSYAEQLRRFATRRIAAERKHLGALAHRLQRMHPGAVLRAQQQRLDELDARLGRGLRDVVAALELRLREAAMRLTAANPRFQLHLAFQRFARAQAALRAAMHRVIERLSLRATLAERSLRSLSPLATLERGYAIVTQMATGSVLTESAKVTPGDSIGVRLARGSLAAKVTRSEPPEEDRD
ncbi:MAG TPA: exodeoxyribonuclease VII large subunit [Gammaproteobacteria bacterium]|jgi:exodeoxyribonuclease VII large subunit